jgi:hypothetical protein
LVVGEQDQLVVVARVDSAQELDTQLHQQLLIQSQLVLVVLAAQQCDKGQMVLPLFSH